jgi:predicted DNA-binding transcriptional regulator AlpA
MLTRQLRYRDLEERGLFNNRVTLALWIRDHGFPRGRLVGPNTRLWDEADVAAWLANRPTEAKPAPKLKPGSQRGRHKAAAKREVAAEAESAAAEPA